MRCILSILFVALMLAVPATAQEEEEGLMTPEEYTEYINSQLTYQTGKITIPGGMAIVDLPEGYGFLGPEDGRFILEDAWGNPPDESVLGLIVPKDSEMPDGWAIIIYFSEDGYIKDDDAKDMDYNELLEQMKEDTQDENAERKKMGYPTVELVGWAESPYYDAETHKLFWAKKIQFEGEEGQTLNYDVRILGRKGVLIYKAVSDAPELPIVAEGCQAVLDATEFTEGNRYRDFNPDLDKVAAYGIGGLIAGKILAKAGILKLLIKPLIVVGAVVAALFGRVFLGKSKKAKA